MSLPKKAEQTDTKSAPAKTPNVVSDQKDVKSSAQGKSVSTVLSSGVQGASASPVPWTRVYVVEEDELGTDDKESVDVSKRVKGLLVSSSSSSSSNGGAERYADLLKEFGRYLGSSALSAPNQYKRNWTHSSWAADTGSIPIWRAANINYIPLFTIGTSNAQRVGNQIRLLSYKIKATLVMVRTTAYTASAYGTTTTPIGVNGIYPQWPVVKMGILHNPININAPSAAPPEIIYIGDTYQGDAPKSGQIAPYSPYFIADQSGDPVSTNVPNPYSIDHMYRNPSCPTELGYLRDVKTYAPFSHYNKTVGPPTAINANTSFQTEMIPETFEFEFRPTEKFNMIWPTSTTPTSSDVPAVNALCLSVWSNFTVKFKTDYLLTPAITVTHEVTWVDDQ